VAVTPVWSPGRDAAPERFLSLYEWVWKSHISANVQEVVRESLAKLKRENVNNVTAQQIRRVHIGLEMQVERIIAAACATYYALLLRTGLHCLVAIHSSLNPRRACNPASSSSMPNAHLDQEPLHPVAASSHAKSPSAKCVERTCICLYKRYKVERNAITKSRQQRHMLRLKMLHNVSE